MGQLRSVVEMLRSSSWALLVVMGIVMWACEYPEPIAERGDRIRLTKKVENFITGLDEGVEGVVLGYVRPFPATRQFGPWIYSVYVPSLGFTYSPYGGFEKVGTDGWELEMDDETRRFLRGDP